MRFERVTGRHYPPDGVKLQPPERRVRDQPMRGMRRIERSTEKPDTLPRPNQWRLRPDRPEPLRGTL